MRTEHDAHAPAQATDPVCGMTVDPATAARLAPTAAPKASASPPTSSSSRARAKPNAAGSNRSVSTVPA